jgi:hypothetical protein
MAAAVVGVAGLFTEFQVAPGQWLRGQTQLPTSTRMILIRSRTRQLAPAEGSRGQLAEELRFLCFKFLGAEDVLIS